MSPILTRLSSAGGGGTGGFSFGKKVVVETSTGPSGPSLPSNGFIVTASDGVSGDRFGVDVGIDADMQKIIVGSANTSKAYIYDLDGTNEIILTHPNPVSLNASFGDHIAIGNNRIAVGALAEGGGAGEVHIFDSNGTGVGIITGNGSERWGYDVSIANNRLYVGTDADKIHILNFDGTYSGVGTITKSGRFGQRLGAGTNRVVVSDWSGGGFSGRAWIYDADGNNEIALVPDSEAGGYYFGYSCAVGENRIATGAFIGGGGLYIYDYDGNLLTDGPVRPAGSDFTFGDRVSIGNNRIYVSNGTTKVSVFDLDGNLIGDLSTVGTGNTHYFAPSSGAGGKLVVGNYNYSGNGVEYEQGSIEIFDS